MSNLKGFWHPHGRGPKRASLDKPAKPQVPKKKRYTKVKVNIVTSAEYTLENGTRQIELESCNVQQFAQWFTEAFPEDARVLLDAMKSYATP